MYVKSIMRTNHLFIGHTWEKFVLWILKAGTSFQLTCITLAELILETIAWESPLHDVINI